MRRREFITLVSGAAASWPLVAHAQQPNRLRRIGVLNSLAETDLDAQAWDAAFRKRFDELGWVDGRNIHIDYRWGAGSVERVQLFAKELVRLNPDVFLSVTTQQPARYCRRPTLSRLCLRSCPIRSAAASSKVSRIRAETSPDGVLTHQAWVANGWRYLRRLRRVSDGSASCLTPPRLHT